MSVRIRRSRIGAWLAALHRLAALYPLAALCSLAALFLLATPDPGRASEPQPTEPTRPRIGIVLSGGGARGAAHVGVLEVLEEMHVPVDFVAGTSMGAVVGGIYATGVDSGDLRVLLDELPWDTMFGDRTRRRDMSFRRKQDDRDFLSTFHFGFEGGRFRLPAGLIQGQKLELVLGLLTLPVATVRDFDDLTIPFRAVATNLTTGEPVVLEGGVLADALRASMAIPGVFSPVILGDKILVDGGTAMNLPVEVARNMGADIIIAIDISTPLRDAEELDSALAVTGQTVTIQIQQNTVAQAKALAQLDPRDVLIRPDLGRVSTMSFNLVGEAADLGRQAALASADKLAPLALDDEAWRHYVEGLARADDEPPLISSVRIDNDSGVEDAVITSRLHVPLGQRLDYVKLAHDIDVLYGIDIFDRINFRIDRMPDETDQLVIIVRGRRTGRNRVRLGIELETDFVSDGLFNLGVNITRMPMNRLAAEWRTQLQIGRAPGITTEFWQPLDAATRWFVAPEFSFQADSIGLFDDAGNQFAEYRVWELGGGLGVGRQLGQWGEIRTGLRFDKARARVIIGIPDFFPSAERVDGEVFVRMALDTLDNARFPRSGTLALAEASFGFEALGSTTNFTSLFLAFTHAMTWKDNTLTFEARSATSFENDNTINNLYALGGFLNLSGLQPNERIGTDMLFFRIRGYRRVAQLGLLSFPLPVYLGFSIESGNTWFGSDQISGSDLLWGGSLYFALDTPFAPLYVAYGNTDGDRNAVYFYLGKVF